MILVWGSQTDAPIERVPEALQSRGADIFHVEESDLASLRYDIVFGATCGGWLELRGRRIETDDLRGSIFDQAKVFRVLRAGPRWFFLHWHPG